MEQEIREAVFTLILIFEDNFEVTVSRVALTEILKNEKKNRIIYLYISLREL